MSVLENLQMGAFQRTDRANFKSDEDRVRPLPVARRAEAAAGGDDVGRRAADVRDRAAPMARPKLLMLDEPSMGLAPIFVEKIFEIVAEINAQGTPILLVEQNAPMMLDAASRGYVMETGVIALEGPAKEPDRREGAQDLPGGAPSEPARPAPPEAEGLARTSSTAAPPRPFRPRDRLPLRRRPARRRDGRRKPRAGALLRQLALRLAAIIGVILGGLAAGLTSSARPSPTAFPRR